MILALLSDVHANLEALQACLQHANDNNATRFAFLGDFVGYGSDADAVLDIVMQYGRQGAVVVKGNHDEAIEGGAPYMNETVRESIEWARKQLTSAQKAFLAALPLSVSDGELFFVHASAVNPQRWIYVDSPHEALRSLRATDAVYMFSGHVHDQLLFAEVDSRATQYTPISGSPIKVGPHRRWLGIVGSVGQPRDGRPSAAYAAFDLASRRLTFYRVPYDHEAAARKIRQAGLSESLAYRVERGV